MTSIGHSGGDSSPGSSRVTEWRCGSRGIVSDVSVGHAPSCHASTSAARVIKVPASPRIPFLTTSAPKPGAARSPKSKPLRPPPPSRRVANLNCQCLDALRLLHCSAVAATRMQHQPQAASETRTWQQNASATGSELHSILWH